jgi:predicted phage terminase large subunit-like protein
MERGKKEIKSALERWRQHCQEVQSATAVTVQESEVEKERRIARLLASYDAFCEYYFPHYMSKTMPDGSAVTVRNAPFHTSAAKRILASPNLRAVFEWPRGHAKSTHMDIFVPLWLKAKGLLHYMVIVGKSQDNADELLSSTQAELEFNQRYIADFGGQKSVGIWTDGYFVTADDVVFSALGRGQSPRGMRYRSRRPDYIVVDDLDDDELSRNPSRVADMTDWVRSALFGSLDVGRGRFIMVGNLFSKTSVLFAVSHIKGVLVSRVDALDRDGNPTWKDKWTKEEAMGAKEFMGYIAWEREYMNNPIVEGKIFKSEWIRYTKILPLREYDELLVYIDPSFKAKTTNDYKAVRFWGRKGRNLHLIDTYVRQDTISGMVRWCYDLWESLPQDVTVRWLMEQVFLQDMILDEFEREGDLRGHQLPIGGDRRQKPDKIQRITDVSPLWERGYVWYNVALKDTPDMQTGIDQTLALEKGSSAHDDAPDADEGAIWYLQRMGRQRNFKPLMGMRPSAKNDW